MGKEGYFDLDQVGQEMTNYYRENGFLVLRNAISACEVKELCKEVVAICRGQRGQFKLERSAEDKTQERVPIAQTPGIEELEDLTDDEVISRLLCLHQPHKCSDLISKFLAHPSITQTLTRVIGPNVKCMQSMLFIKSAGKPGQAWHQDENYIPTRDRSLCGAWIALDDATVDNGCLHIIPGSHKSGIQWPQYPHNDERFDCSYASYKFPYDDTDSIPVEVPKGSAVFFNGYTLHRSLPNTRQSGFRRALVNHYMSAESFLPWACQEGVAMAKTDFRDVVMVAGEDPYPWKKYQDITEPSIRPVGEGGCGDGRVDLVTFRESDRNDKEYL